LIAAVTVAVQSEKEAGTLLSCARCTKERIGSCETSTALAWFRNEYRDYEQRPRLPGDLPKEEQQRLEKLRRILLPLVICILKRQPSTLQPENYVWNRYLQWVLRRGKLLA
jgi:hypothetical protein